MKKEATEMSTEEIIDELQQYGKQLGNKRSSTLLCEMDGRLSPLGVRALKLQHLLAAHFEIELQGLMRKYQSLTPPLQGEVWWRYTEHIKDLHRAYMEGAMQREKGPAGKEFS